MNAIDTNILVYAVDNADPKKSAEAETLVRNLAWGIEPLVIPW